MVHILINNYKAQKNVRAELGGAVDLGEPVSLYIAEDEVKYGSDNLVSDPSLESGTTGSWTSTTSGTFAISTSNSTRGKYSLHMTQS